MHDVASAVCAVAACLRRTTRSAANRCMNARIAANDKPEINVINLVHIINGTRKLCVVAVQFANECQKLRCNVLMAVKFIVMIHVRNVTQNLSPHS